MMNGVFNTGLTFWQLIGGIVLSVLSVIAIRISFKFDLNKYLEKRQELLRARAQNACMHFQFITDDDNQVIVKSFFVSPPGTIRYQCQRCGLVRYRDDDEWERTANYYAEHIDEYHKQNKKFTRLLKKGGVL